jgi:hypothetical protein
MNIEYFLERYGERSIVNFIWNRHCSRFNKDTASISEALDSAWSYHVEEETILEDLINVESYNDLEQYFR